MPQTVLGAQLGVTTETARRYCLDPDNAKHIRPGREVSQLLSKLFPLPDDESGDWDELNIANYADKVPKELAERYPKRRIHRAKKRAVS